MLCLALGFALLTLAPVAGTREVKTELRVVADAQRAEWRTWLAAPDSVWFLHEQEGRRPVPFATRRPCAYAVRILHGDERVGAEPATRLAAALARLLAEPTTAIEPQGACPADSSDDGDEVRLLFSSADNYLAVEFRPKFGALTVADRARSVWHGTDRASAELLTRLVEALPDDARLHDLPLCSDEARRAVPESLEPRSGQFVQIDAPPTLTTPVSPVYPEEAIRQELSGTVQIRALVGRDGTVSRTLVEFDRAISPLLQEAAVAAVEGYVFAPARLGDRPAATWVAVPVKFSLR